MDVILMKKEHNDILNGKEFELNRKFKHLRSEKDLVSSIFETMSLKEDREKFGQFFTHKEIVDFILNNIPINENTKVIDPTCGAGAFLIELLNRGVDINNIYGVDIDFKALELCKLNIYQNDKNKKDNLLCNNFIGDPDIKNEFKEILKNGGFDIVVGNPPFINLKRDGIDYSLNQKILNEVCSGIANSASLVIAKSYELLKEDGYLGFVLPKNILRVESFNALRKFLLEKTKLRFILDLDHHFKEVRGDQIVLIFQKKAMTKEETEQNKIKLIPYKEKEKYSEKNAYYLSQAEFFKYDFFPLFYDQDVKKLADKLMKIPQKLKDVADIFRGISLGSNNPLISKDGRDNLVKCFRGDSISRFGIKYPLFIDLNKLGTKEANKIKRLQNEKIILQNICSKEGGIFATISNKNDLSLDTVTNIIPNDPSTLKYLLGLTSSKLANFFMIFVVYLNSNFTMHTDKRYIGKLPIINPSKDSQELISSLVDKLIVIDDKYSMKFFEIYSQLNKEVYDIYGLDKSEIALVEGLLNKVMSKKQNG